jgi:Protein of unknown function (DUF2934)
MDLQQQVAHMELTLEPALELRIRERAYEIWHADGRADGKAHEHWLAAEREVLSSLSPPSPTPEASASPKAAKPARASSRAATQRSAGSKKSKR